MSKRAEERQKRREKRLKGKVTFRTIFLLAVTLIFNTYAWFLYVNTVTADITAHVDSWMVRFEVDGEEVQHSFMFNIPHAYPGMSDASKTVMILNNGEKNAHIDYEVRYVRIFDDIYFAQESIDEGQTAPQGATIANASDLLTMIQSTYPFVISFSATSYNLQPDESANLTITFEWDYESGNDTVDTEYGINAYNFYEDNVNEENAIEILVNVIVDQYQN